MFWTIDNHARRVSARCSTGPPTGIIVLAKTAPGRTLAASSARTSLAPDDTILPRVSNGSDRNSATDRVARDSRYVGHSHYGSHLDRATMRCRAGIQVLGFGEWPTLGSLRCHP